jgi:predicted lipid carrier protein YhbT
LQRPEQQAERYVNETLRTHGFTTGCRQACRVRPAGISAPLSLPFVLLPEVLHGRAVVVALNRIFAVALREGELDFMQGRSLRIVVQDMQLGFCLTLSQDRLTALQVPAPDLSISGNLHAFMLMAARRADPDTLFFQRLLRMEGDTGLGLALKNFLAAQDMEERWLTRQMQSMLQRALPLYERWF